MRVRNQAKSPTLVLNTLIAHRFLISHRLWELCQASHIYPKAFGTGAWRELVEECHPLISVVFLD